MDHLFWGVDVGMDSTALAIVGDGSVVFRHPETKDKRYPIAERLSQLAESVERIARESAASKPPFCVCVERPTGRFPKPHLYYAAGAVLIGLERGLRDRFPYPILIFQAGVSQWKKATVGKGNATKDDVAAWALAQPELADRHGVYSQDDIDAFAIARYAQGAVS